MIPKIIHRIDAPARLEGEGIDGWIVNHWTREDIKEYLLRRGAWGRRWREIFKCLILLEQGGIYLDNKYILGENIEEWLRGDCSILRGKAYGGLMAQIVGAVPGSVAVGAALKEITMTNSRENFIWTRLLASGVLDTITMVSMSNVENTSEQPLYGVFGIILVVLACLGYLAAIIVLSVLIKNKGRGA